MLEKKKGNDVEIKDVRKIKKYIKKKYEEMKVVILGNQMGGMIEMN